MTRRMMRAAGAAVLGMTLGAAACGDSTGPLSDWDPHRTLDRMDDVLVPFETSDDLLVGLDLAVEELEYYGGTAYAAAVSLEPTRREGLLRALRPPRPLARSASARPSDGSASARPSDGSDGSASLDGADGSALLSSALALPGSLLGATMVWDPVEGYYRISTLGGAPSDGVRFILYELNGGDIPASPLTPFGYVDFRSPGGLSDDIEVRALRTAGADRVIARYTVSFQGSGSYSDGSMEVTASGELGDGASLAVDLLQRMSWSQSRDRDELRLQYRYRRGGRAVELHGQAESRFEALEWSTFDFEVQFEGERPVTEIDARIDRDGRLQGEIRSDGRTAIRISGWDSQPTFERPNREPLDWSDVDALEELWLGVGDLVWWTEWVLVPADYLAS